VGQIGYFFNIILTFPIFNVLMLLDRLFGDFGLSIIVLTLLMRLLLVPLTLKQLRSTKATQAIQPLMADVRKKYANDQRAQYEAMQALYKEYNIKPLSGCLPLLVQLPVLYGLLFALRTVLTPPAGHALTVATINSIIYPFLPKFLSLPSFSLDWFTFLNSAWHISLAQGDPTHILPVLAGLATFAQLRMSQARTSQSSSGSKDMMTQQMQLMSFVMPFVTFFVALSFPAGLALYWTTTSIFGMVQQYFVTGWGSLFTLPDLGGLLGGNKNSSSSNKSNNSKLSVSNVRKETSLLSKVVDANAAEVVAEIASPRGNGSTSNSSGRRRRPNSASARRRSTTPRRNPSRS
jgi:YidC/Oxa1 family membrane protein insertase